MVATYTIDGIRRGNTFARTFKFKNANNTAFDLSGSTLIFAYDSLSGVIRKSSATNGSGFVITNASGGEATITLLPSETRNLKIGRTTRFELERQIAGNEVTLLSGCIIVYEGINNDN